MTDILAILGVAVLFVVMALFYRHRSCSERTEDGSCTETCSHHAANCDLKQTSESTHAHS